MHLSNFLNSFQKHVSDIHKSGCNYDKSDSTRAFATLMFRHGRLCFINGVLACGCSALCLGARSGL